MYHGAKSVLIAGSINRSGLFFTSEVCCGRRRPLLRIVSGGGASGAADWPSCGSRAGGRAGGRDDGATRALSLRFSGLRGATDDAVAAVAGTVGVVAGAVDIVAGAGIVAAPDVSISELFVLSTASLAALRRPSSAAATSAAATEAGISLLFRTFSRWSSSKCDDISRGGSLQARWSATGRRAV